MQTTIGRNDPCHCGSGKKYKKCHIEKDEAENRKARERAALNAAKVAAKEDKKEEKDSSKPSHPHEQKQGGWIRKMAGKVGFFRTLSQRRISPTNKGG